MTKNKTNLEDKIFELEERVQSLTDESLNLCEKYNCTDQEVDILLQISDPDAYMKDL